MKYVQLVVGIALFSGIGLFAYKYTQHKSVDFVIVCPTYNNEKWCIKNIKSVVEQSYQRWHMVIVNDCSTDATSERMHRYVKEHNLQDKITIIENTERKGALRNLYEAIHQCPDESVIVTLDGDDWFATKRVLERIAQEYAEGKTWLTYGQYMCKPYTATSICKKLPEFVMKQRLFRTYEWVSSHPRTFYAWLFKKIKQEDLMHKGKFFSVTWDLAMMFPMMEMASAGHIRFIPEVLYIYNIANPLNDYKCHFELQQWCAGYIRGKEKYEAL
jgi:glycosyltransferase involved in cell wall biosynthesis